MFFVISRYNENVDWINSYTNSYLIYDKSGNKPKDFRWISSENIGGNQRDLTKFVYENYDCLPELTSFIQAYPWDHCKQEVFDVLIKSTVFTPLEYYGDSPANGWEQRTKDSGYLEVNNNWYIKSHNASFSKICPYTSFDEFMNKYFINYIHLDWIRFSPGSQYIVPRRNLLQYSRNFWCSLMNEMNEFNGTTAHIVERSLFYILRGDYEPRYI